MASDNYEVIDPGVPMQGVPGEMVPDGSCASCGPAEECYGPGACWGPGDCYGGDCYPFLRPLRDRVWYDVDYLLWWFKSDAIPPLVTTSSTADAGVLGRGSTRVLFDDQSLKDDNRSGARFKLGTWLDACHCSGFEVNYMFIAEDTTQYQSGILSDMVLARPFYDGLTGQQSSWVLASPGQLQGWANVQSTSEFFSVEALLRRRLHEDCQRRIDLLLGYRHLSLKERLSIDDHRMRIGQSQLEPLNQQIDQLDVFDTENVFNGAEVGISTQSHYNRWSLQFLMKVALGNTRSRIDISGMTATRLGNTIDPPTPGGLLTQATNIGQYEDHNFAVVPELGVTLGYDLTCHLRCTMGYNFLYWSKVARPGDQIDTNIQLPDNDGAVLTHPEFQFTTTDFWAQGLSFGLDYRF